MCDILAQFAFASITLNLYLSDTVKRRKTNTHMKYALHIAETLSPMH